MSNPKKCANAICTCLAQDKKKYCSDHCEGIGNRTEIFCLCGHADCGVTAIQSSNRESGSRTDVGGPAARL
jgi:hypothetical protein